MNSSSESLSGRMGSPGLLPSFLSQVVIQICSVAPVIFGSFVGLCFAGSTKALLYFLSPFHGAFFMCLVIFFFF